MIDLFNFNYIDIPIFEIFHFIDFIFKLFDYFVRLYIKRIELFF